MKNILLRLEDESFYKMLSIKQDIEKIRKERMSWEMFIKMIFERRKKDGKN